MPHSKTLFLLRHAKSSWDDPSVEDIDRPLNKRGKRDAPEMGRRLAEYAVKPERVVSSPARRALKTAESVSKELGFKKQEIKIDKRLYTWGSDAFLDIINGLDDRYNSVMMVCHNPAITEVVNELSGAGIYNVPTCGVAVIKFNVDKWSGVKRGKGELLKLDYPKKL